MSNFFKDWTPQMVAARNAKVALGKPLRTETAASLMAGKREAEMKKKTSRIFLANTRPAHQMVTIVLPYPPSANRYWRSIVIAGQVRVLVSSEARIYKRTAASIAAQAFSRPLTGPVGIRLHVFRPRRAGDLGNRIKVIEDALQGFAFTDDSQIEHIEAMRFEDKDNPRVEVTVWGITEDKE